MARIQYSAAVDEITGSIGAITFQRNASGSTARGRGSRTKAVNELTTDSHRLINQFQEQWRNMELNTRNDWNDFAEANTRVDKFGRTKSLTGYQWFQSINHFRVLFNQSILLTPPSFTLPPPTPTFTIEPNGQVLDIELDDPVSVSGVGLVVMATMPMLQVPKVPFRFLRRIHHLALGSEQTGINLNTEYNEYFSFAGTNFDNLVYQVLIFTVQISTGLIRPGVIRAHYPSFT